MEVLIKDISNLKESDILLAGGKAQGLWKLFRQGVNIPPTWILPPQSKDSNWDIIQTQINEIIPENLEGFAVRSSAIEEDGMLRSYAGYFHTELCVEKEKISKAILTCYQSQGIDRPLPILIQPMISCVFSGVGFSIHPIRGKEYYIIEWVEGLGASLVSGEETPGFWEGEKSTQSVSNFALPRQENGLFFDKIWEKKEPPKNFLEKSLQEAVIQNLLSIESNFRYSVDIEWGWNGSQLFIFQARPITT